MKMPGYRSYVVTGGAQGIGRAIASRLTLDGYVIVIDVADDLGWAHERVRLVSGNAGTRRSQPKPLSWPSRRARWPGG
jgi:NAD(P)-dependent dehydrogenase (short-subunit alcohol dehydrogenase family)